MTKYDVIYESLQSQLDQDLISMQLAEEVNDLAYEKYVVEDKSDIATNYAMNRDHQRFNSEHHLHKRPKIHKNMTAISKHLLHAYDHGSPLNPEVHAYRYLYDDQGKDQTAFYKKHADDINKLSKETYDREEANLAEKRLKNKKIAKENPNYFKDKKGMQKSKLSEEPAKNDLKKEESKVKNDTSRDKKREEKINKAYENMKTRKDTYDNSKKNIIKKNIKAGLRQSKNAFIPHKKIK